MATKRITAMKALLPAMWSKSPLFGERALKLLNIPQKMKTPKKQVMK